MTRPGHVLVVDDEVSIGHVLRLVLSTEHRVVLETSGAAALERIAAGERFDAVLCDVSMPNMTGPDFLDALRERAPDLAERFVFMTGGVTNPRVRERLAASGRPILDKPFDVESLRAIVRAYVLSADRRSRAAPG